MAKGAKKTGGTAGRKKAKDSEMAAHLPPAPATWNKRADLWPYHNNLGTTHARPDGE